jgi:hypothetical protein
VRVALHGARQDADVPQEDTHLPTRCGPRRLRLAPAAARDTARAGVLHTISYSLRYLVVFVLGRVYFSYSALCIPQMSRRLAASFLLISPRRRSVRPPLVQF